MTTLYLLRHGATNANVAKPYRLQGRGSDPALSQEGIRQSQLTRDFLLRQPIDHFYSSPMQRALQTAEIIAGPRKASVTAVSELTECDVGRWEGLSWEAIREQFPEDHRQFMADPAKHGYPGGETFADVARRVMPIFDSLLAKHSDETLLIVGHHVVNRVYLASLLGLTPSQARQVTLDNCGLSVVIRNEEKTRLATLNCTFHLNETAAGVRGCEKMPFRTDASL